jgi:hypothetical protein
MKHYHEPNTTFLILEKVSTINIDEYRFEAVVIKRKH